jgi:uncharacterized SAM-binding protein YcdF (DUF218 family)
MKNRADTLAERIWRYHQMNHPLVKSDVILVLCSHDIRVAERGAELFLDGWAPLLVFSGGLGAITKHIWDEPEADQFAKVAAAMGVPKQCILVENQSTNTGENILFTRRLMDDVGIDPKSVLLVQKPYMERRSYATFRKVWPEKEVVVTSPRAAFDQYLAAYSNSRLTRDEVIAIMVGDLHRIKVYPEKGYQAYEEIPEDVWAAFEELVGLGYDKYLVT